jgi:hypothetical protein
LEHRSVAVALLTEGSIWDPLGIIKVLVISVPFIDKIYIKVLIIPAVNNGTVIDKINIKVLMIQTVPAVRPRPPNS